MNELNEKHFSGWVLYDGNCGVCKLLIEKWRPVITSCGYKIAPLQSDWVKGKISLSDEELVKDILLITVDDKLIRGADVYREVMKQVWWLYPFYLISIIPGLNYIFNWSYRIFNLNRHRISSSCKLPN